jgi:2Fe-2S ferredoxin
MPKITVLPHPDVCPEGRVIEDATAGVSICRVLLDHHIEIEHACELSCACTTCHVIVKEGFNSLAEASDSEEDLLDRAWGLSTHSRLSCQALVADTDLTIEIPRYTINHAKESH